jgi:hypothetical protein
MDQLQGRRAHLRPIVLLAIHTGMRKSELLNLRWPNVDFARGLNPCDELTPRAHEGKEESPDPDEPGREGNSFVAAYSKSEQAPGKRIRLSQPSDRETRPRGKDSVHECLRGREN